MKAVKKMLVSMKLHLDASIDKLDNLAMNVKLDKEKHMENMKKHGSVSCSSSRFTLISWMPVPVMTGRMAVLFPDVMVYYRYFYYPDFF